MNNSNKPRRRGSSAFNGGRKSTRGKRGHSRKSYGGNNKRRFGGRNRGKSRFGGKAISHDKFINKNPSTHVEETYSPSNTFADFGFDQSINASLEKRGYKTPTPIQDQAIPHILSGKDVVGLADTGSGKTAAFVLPIIQKLKAQPSDQKMVRESVLIITPTRELAKQIQDEFDSFTQGMSFYSVLCVGGLNIRFQIKDLRRGVNVVIGTPGRLKDLIERRELRLDNATTLVLDEADRMLDMGFLPDIKSIIEKLPKKRQSLCFSATIAPEVSKLLEQMLVDPITVSVRTSVNGDHIAQDIIKARGKEDKMKELVGMLEKDHFEKVLIFGQMKYSVQKLADELTKLGFPSMAIHGNKSQPQRQRSLDAFKKGKINILVATDVAARGLDIPNVSHVINFDQPQTHQDYVHRIGRTGRAGKSGQAYTFVG